MPRTSIKGQVLVDLVAKFAKSPIEMVTKQRDVEGKSVGVCWKVYVDGAAN